MNYFTHKSIVPRFIVLEGIDGAGKSTQAKILANHIRSLGKRVFITGEPTYMRNGRVIRRVLNKKSYLPPETLYILYAADRCEHVYHSRHGILRHARDENSWVICTRYIYSSYAYQQLHSPIDCIVASNELFPLPAYLIYIDIGIQRAIRRLHNRHSRDIFEKERLLKQVASHYHDILRDSEEGKTEIVRVNGDQEPHVVGDAIWDGVRASIQ